MKTPFFKFICVIALFAFDGTSLAKDPLGLTIVYTAETNAKLVGCDCPHDTLGGLSERVTLIEELRKELPHFLLLDLGNMSTLYGDWELMARTVMRLMNLMTYDAAAASRNEFYWGAPGIRRLISEASFPIISSNASAEGRRNYSPFFLKNTPVGRVLVASLSDSSSIAIPGIGFSNPITITPPQKALTDILKGKRADYVVIISRLDRNANRGLLRNFPSINLILECGEKAEQPTETYLGGIILSSRLKAGQAGMVRIARKSNRTDLLLSRMYELSGYQRDPRAERIVNEYYRKRK